MRGPAVVLLLAALPAAGAPNWEAADGRRAEAAILKRWTSAGPDERRRMRAVLDRIERDRRFAEARPVLVTFEQKRWSLAEIFNDVLEPALRTATNPETKDGLGLQELHRRALAALGVLGRAYAPPRPVRTATLNLLLGYAHAAITAPALPAAARLRFFVEALRNVRGLDGRAQPDARTRWLVHERLLPALLGLARRMERDPLVREVVSEAASLLYLPAILDGQAQAQLAPLTRGVHAREILLRSYRQGHLDRMGVVALARTLALQIRDDVAFAAGASPLLLELLCDARLTPRDRGGLLASVLSDMARIQPLRGAARNLAAAGFGGPPRPLSEYRKPRSVPSPAAAGSFRFLSVVLMMDAPPVVARVMRVDIPFYTPIRAGGRFVGVLVPNAAGDHADLLGPPPGLGGARDNRLLRRTLRRERIAITTFGVRSQEVELCVALPEDASEPVPSEGARLGHVLDLMENRLDRTVDEDERGDLVRLLVRIGTVPGGRLAGRPAPTPKSGVELLPRAEAGDRGAALQLLALIGKLPLDQLERALAAILASGDAAIGKQVRRLCARKDVAIAALAADALLGHGDASGVPILLGHDNRYARACGTSLALRLTDLAGSLRVIPKQAVSLEKIGALAAAAFKRSDGECWWRYARWLAHAFEKPQEVRAARAKYESIDNLPPAEFGADWLNNLREGKQKEGWKSLPPFLLSPAKPGRGIPERQLSPLLDALEAHARVEPLRNVWIDSLVVLACAQYGIEMDAGYLSLAHKRLARAAGDTEPKGARRKAGVYWPIWAAQEAR